MGREGARYIQKKIHDGYVTGDGRKLGKKYIDTI